MDDRDSDDLDRYVALVGDRRVLLAEIDRLREILADHVRAASQDEELRQQCYDAWEHGYDWGASDGDRRLNRYRDEAGKR